MNATSFGAAIQQLAELVEQQRAAIVDRRDAKLGALGEAELLPGHDVGVVLEIGDDDLVARADVLLAEGRGDQVDRLRSCRA